MRKVSMFDLQELVRLHRMGTGCRQISRLLKISPNTERAYRDAFIEAGLLQGAVNELPSLEQLKQAVIEQLGPGTRPEQLSSAEPWRESIERWLELGTGPTAIYERLKRQEQDDLKTSLSAVKRLCQRIERSRGVSAEKVVIAVHTPPGQVAQVDFGDVGQLLDPEQQVMRKAYVFVMVLGYSRHQYCEIVFDQKVETWLQCHQNAFEFFGGVPEVIVPDNLKSAVIRAAFSSSDPVTLNRSYRELARHYCFKVDPTPPYAPNKKGKVESSVKYVKNNFFKSYGQSLGAQQLQIKLTDWVEQTAGQRRHGSTHQKPLQVFIQEEKTTLKPLPPTRFETVIWKNATVHTDSHVQFDRALYSVPWRYVRKKVLIRATAKNVRVLVDELTIASHDRCRDQGRRITQEEHLPAHRRDLRHRSESYWVERADRIGVDVGTYIREVFQCDDVLSQLRTVQAIVTFLEGYPESRANAACRRALFYGNTHARAVKNILARALDQQPLPVASLPATPLSPPRFARDITQLLDHHLEQTHACH